MPAQRSPVCPHARQQPLLVRVGARAQARRVLRARRILGRRDGVRVGRDRGGRDGPERDKGKAGGQPDLPLPTRTSTLAMSSRAGVLPFAYAVDGRRANPRMVGGRTRGRHPLSRGRNYANYAFLTCDPLCVLCSFCTYRKCPASPVRASPREFGAFQCVSSAATSLAVTIGLESAVAQAPPPSFHHLRPARYPSMALAFGRSASRDRRDTNDLPEQELGELPGSKRTKRRPAPSGCAYASARERPRRTRSADPASGRGAVPGGGT